MNNTDTAMSEMRFADNNQVIALKPDDFRAYYNRGIARGMLGNHQQATSDYNLALINIPQTSSAQQGETKTSEKTFLLLKNLQQQLSSLSEIALVECEGSFEIKTMCLYYL